jgi:hypothetical protein
MDKPQAASQRISPAGSMHCDFDALQAVAYGRQRGGITF